MTSRIAWLMALLACGSLPALADTNYALLRLRVVDAETGQPLPSVRVRAWVRVNPTDDSGVCLLPRPKSWPESLGCRITLSESGYVGQYISWSQAQHDKVQDIPAEFTARLEKGVSIGGIVKNERGEPMPGADVMLSGPSPTDLGARVLSVVGPDFHAERTDAEGKWRYDRAPRELQRLLFHVSHSEYAPANFACEGAAVQVKGITQLPKEDLLARKAAMILGQGIILSGRVTDATGQPVAGAVVTRDFLWRDPATLLSTDAQGRFAISNLLPGDLYLAIQVKGLAAQTRLLTLSNAMPELKIEMAPGRLFQGRVVDPFGKPLAGAVARMVRPEQRPLEYDWCATTDSLGRFSWDAAPEGAHPYSFSAPGYHPRNEPALVADGSNHVITLRPKSNGDKTMVDGQVVEAATKTPVRHFIVYVEEYNGHTVSRFQQAVSDADGRYRVAVATASAGYVIKIGAPGCRMATSPQKSPGGGDFRLDFALEKGE